MSELISDLRERGNLASNEEALCLLRHALVVLNSQLTQQEADWLAVVLPPQLAGTVAGPRHEEHLEPEQLYERLAQRQGVSLAKACEQAQLAYSALAASLPDETLTRLRKHLPRYSELLNPESPASRVAPSAESSPGPAMGARTLAQGRPGATRPLSSSRAGSTHPLSESRADRTSVHSLVRSDEPHADTKLSSSRGLTQERESETLASGRPAGKQ